MTVKEAILITGHTSYCLKNIVRFVIVLVTLLLGTTITFASQTVVTDIKIRNFESKTRIVLDFSSELKNYTVKRVSNSMTSITINNAGVLDKFDNTILLGDYHKLIIAKSSSNLHLNIDISDSRLYTFTLREPDRLIIDINGLKNKTETKPLSNKEKSEFFPGITHKQYTLRGPVFVNVLDIDLNSPFIELMPVTANKNTLFSKRTVNQMVNVNKGLVGINASFFKPPNGLPLGTVIIDSNFITGPIFNRVALVVDKNNKAYIDRVKLDSKCTLPDGTSLNIQNINQPRLSVDGYMLYSDKWNTIVPKTLKNELQVTIQNGKITAKTIGSTRVPENGFVITGPNKDNFKNLKIGDNVDLKISYKSNVTDIKHAIGGGPYLLKDGKIYVDAKDQKFCLNNSGKEPRTAVGITDNNHLLLVTVDGRQKGTIGMTFHELARFLKSLGAVHAMNFDGGSSTQMSIKGKTVNRPTVRGGALISTGIIVKEADNISVANKLP